jgi:predicted DNA-binding transcriptional regulator YafY
LTKEQLQNLCAAAGLSKSGTRDEVFERLSGNRNIVIPPTGDDISLERFVKGVEDSEQVYITYTSHFGKTTKRYIVPLYTYELFDSVTGEALQYVYAFCFKQRDGRNFCLSRIDEIRWTGKKFQVQEMLYLAIGSKAKEAPRKVAAMEPEVVERFVASGVWGRTPVHLRRTIVEPRSGLNVLSW